MVYASCWLLRSTMLPRTAFDTSVTLSCPAAWARSFGALVTCRANNCAAATSISTKMTELPARCGKTNDAPRVPASTAWRVRRSRAEWPCAASGRPAAPDFLALRKPFGFSASRSLGAFSGVRSRFGCRTALASCGLRGPRVGRDRRVRPSSPRLTEPRLVSLRRGARAPVRPGAPAARAGPGLRPGVPAAPYPVARAPRLPPATVPVPIRAGPRPGSALRRAPERSLGPAAPAAPASAGPARSAPVSTSPARSAPVSTSPARSAPVSEVLAWAGPAPAAHREAARGPGRRAYRAPGARSAADAGHPPSSNHPERATALPAPRAGPAPERHRDLVAREPQLPAEAPPASGAAADLRRAAWRSTAAAERRRP